MINFEVKGTTKVIQYLVNLPRKIRSVAMEAIVKYIVGDARHGMVHYEPYKYVTRKKAYGQTWASDKQRRYVMAKIRSGEITPGIPNRTGATAAGWSYARKDDLHWYIKNPTTGAYYTRGEPGQARLNKLVGWRQMTKVVMDNIKGALRAGKKAIRDLIDSGK